MNYNHNRQLNEFDQQLLIIRNGGFMPIAVSQMYFEDVFVFKTKEEAENAYKTFEQGINNKNIEKVVGFWYGEEEFKEEVEKYEKEYNDFKVRIHWI